MRGCTVKGGDEFPVSVMCVVLCLDGRSVV